MKISVLIKDPGKKPWHVWIQNSLKNLQVTVGGVHKIGHFGCRLCHHLQRGRTAARIAL